MVNRIYFCGEVVADAIGQHEKTDEFKICLGGSHYNSALGASRAAQEQHLDIKIGFVGTVSRDVFGDGFMKSLKDRNIDTTGVSRVDHNTTLAIVSVRPGMENAFSFYGTDTTAQITRTEDLPVKLGDDGDNIILCFGSISTVMEPARFAWLEFAKRNRDKALIFYDLNARPAIAKDAEKYRSILKEWTGIAHVMKASDADLAWAYPDKSLKEVADLWLGLGISLAVFTKGKDGSEVYSRSQAATAPVMDLEITHTIGAGDNFNAGFAIALTEAGCATPQHLDKLDQESLAKILQYANDTAAYHLITLGAYRKPSSSPACTCSSGGTKYSR